MKTKLAKDATLGIDRFNTLINNVGQFTISEMHALASLYACEQKPFIFAHFWISEVVQTLSCKGFEELA